MRNVNPGGEYVVPNDGVYVLTATSDNKDRMNAWWYKDGQEFFGTSIGEVHMPLSLRKGTKLTVRSGEGFVYTVRAVF